MELIENLLVANNTLSKQNKSLINRCDMLIKDNNRIMDIKKELTETSQRIMNLIQKMEVDFI